MKAKVNKDACIGCGSCTVIASDVFEIDEDGLAVADESKITEENKEEVVDACESCPTSAIEVEE